MVDKAHAALDKLSTIVHGLDKLSTIVHGLDAIEGVAKHVLGDSTQNAFEALHVIAVIIDTVRAGLHEKLTVEEVQKEIQSLRVTIAGNDATANAALDKKFDKG
jgi:hypothetical protein